MKIRSLLFISLIAFASCKNEAEESSAAVQVADSGEATLPPVDVSQKKGGGNTIDSSKFTTVQWLDALKDFGTVRDGEKVNISFRFKNTGDHPLIIQSVHAGCGCTVPEYTQEPVMPGKEGFIKAVFNSSGQPPTVHKTVNVIMNTKPEQRHEVAFIGEVIK